MAHRFGFGHPATVLNPVSPSRAVGLKQVIRYRPFLNTDPPLLVDIWRQQDPLPGQVDSLTHADIDRHILSKQYFDRNGLILALEDDGSQTRPLGFVHAGFAPNPQKSDLDLGTGIICQVKVVPCENRHQVASSLLKLGMEYLKRQNAVIVHGGSDFPAAPFYRGCYGGSHVPGVLDGDDVFWNCLEADGFEVGNTIDILELDLGGFRAVIDREQMTLRRQYQIKSIVETVEETWWESCTMGLFEREIFTVAHKLHLNVCGKVSYWDYQPLARERGGACRGMLDLEVAPELWKIGMATFLVGESLRHLMLHGVNRIEAQVFSDDVDALALLKKMGFQQLTRGSLMSRRT